MNSMSVDVGNNILDLFVNGNGEYDKKLQFQVIVLMVALMIFFNYYFKNNYGFVIILLFFVIYIASFWLKAQRGQVGDFNKITLNKLRGIQDNVNKAVEIKITQIRKTSGKDMSSREIRKLYKQNNLGDLYIDANMIHFIDSLSPLYKYNPSEYVLFVKGINTILRLRREIEDFYEANQQYPINISEMLESSLELKRKTMNNLHQFIYSVPKTQVMYKYIDDVLDRYNVLITRNIDIIHTYHQMSIKQRGINNRTKFVSYDTTKPYDELDNHPIVPTKFTSTNNNASKRRSETIPFYI